MKRFEFKPVQKKIFMNKDRENTDKNIPEIFHLGADKQAEQT